VKVNEFVCIHYWIFYSCTNLIFPFFFSDKERHYNRIHLIFLEQNPAISLFHTYHPSWEFSKDSTKFHSISIALSSAPNSAVNKWKSSDKDSIKDDEVLVTRQTNPNGTKKSKRRQEEEKIIEKVSSTLKENLSPAREDGTSSHVLAAALRQFTSLLTKSFHSWQDRQL